MAGRDGPQFNDEAIAALEELGEEFDRRLVEDPHDALQWTRELDSHPALTEDQLLGAKAGCLIDAGEASSEREAIKDGLDIYNDLCEKHPGVLTYAYNRARALSLLNSPSNRPPEPAWFLETSDSRWEVRQQYAMVASAAATGGPSARSLASRAKANQANLLKDSYRGLEAYDAYREAVLLDPTNAIASFGAAKLLKWFADRRFPQHELLLRLAEQYRTLGEAAVDDGRPFTSDQRAEMKLGIENQLAEEAPSVDLSDASPFAQFVVDHDLALSLALDDRIVEEHHWDTLRLSSIRQSTEEASAQPPPIYGMFNTLKSDFATARWLLFRGLHADVPETAHYADTLDYANYGVEQGLITLAQRSAVDLLDRVAVAATEYFDLEDLDRIYFSNRWHADPYSGSTEWRPRVAQEIEDGNTALIALSELAKDFSAHENQQGALWDKKDLRHASTHRFVILHEMGTGPDDPSDHVEHRAQSQFVAATLDSLRVARAAIFYLAEAIALREGRMHRQDAMKDGVVMPMWVPYHHEIRKEKGLEFDEGQDKDSDPKQYAEEVTVENLEKGDVVQLKSGSPEMTVAGENSWGEIICQWFDGTEQKSETFPEESLNKVDEESG